MALIYDARREGECLYAGLLIVQAGLKRHKLTFEDPTTREKTILILPENALKLKRAANTARVSLEVYER